TPDRAGRPRVRDGEHRPDDAQPAQPEPPELVPDRVGSTRGRHRANSLATSSARAFSPPGKMPHPSAAPCPSHDELLGLVEGLVAGAALGRLKEHVASCRVCAGVVAGLGSAEVRAVRPSTSGVDVGWARAIVAEEMASSLERVVAKPSPTNPDVPS